jgi:uncharacterized cupredoxin-like copper-binding protein
MLVRRRLRSWAPRFGVGVVLCALALILLSSCSSGDSDKARAGAVVRVRERDFRITLSPARVRAGTVRLLIRNKGPDTHEALVVRSSGRPLPLRSDGLTVNEAALEGVTVGTEEAQSPGTVEELLLHLKPGRYELFCNMAGHYLGGMRAVLVVT